MAFIFHTATSQMIGVMEADASLERVQVSWLEPKFRPTALRLTFLCAEPMDYTDRKTTTYDVLNATHVQVYGMKPGTKCVVTLLATYNPANLNDNGIQRRVAVPSASKYMLVCNERRCVQKWHRVKGQQIAPP